jgi:hypothetical protein
MRDSKADLSIRLVRSELADCSRQPFTVSWVDFRKELLEGKRCWVANSEDIGAVSAQQPYAGTGIPLISKPPACLGCETQLFLTVPPCPERLETAAALA